MKTIFAILWLSLPFSLCDDRRAFQPRRSPTVLALARLATDIPRGGAGPLDPELTAKVITATIGAQGVACSLLPDISCDMYGYDRNPLSHYAMRGVGAYISYTTALLGLRLCYPDMTELETIGYAGLVGSAIGWLCTNDRKQMGDGDATGVYVAWLLGAVATVVALTNPGRWATPFMKGMTIFGLTQFLWGLSSPKELMAVWKVDIGSNRKDRALMMHMIHWGFMSHMTQLLVLYGSCSSATQLVGAALLVPLKFFGEVWLITEEVTGLPLAKEKYAFWTALSAVGVVTLLL